MQSRSFTSSQFLLRCRTTSWLPYPFRNSSIDISVPFCSGAAPLRSCLTPLRGSSVVVIMPSSSPPLSANYTARGSRLFFVAVPCLPISEFQQQSPSRSPPVFSDNSFAMCLSCPLSMVLGYAAFFSVALPTFYAAFSCTEVRSARLWEASGSSLQTLLICRLVSLLGTNQSV